MPAVAVRHERRRQEKKVVCVNNLNSGEREGTSNTTGNRRPSLLTLQSPHSQTGTPITSPPYIQNSLPDIYVCSKGVRAALSRGDHTDRSHTADRRARSVEAGRGRIPIQVRVDLFRSDHYAGRHYHGHCSVLPAAVGHQTSTEKVHSVNTGHAVDRVIMERTPRRQRKTIEISACLLLTLTHLQVCF